VPSKILEHSIFSDGVNRYVYMSGNQSGRGKDDMRLDLFIVRYRFDVQDVAPFGFKLLNPHNSCIEDIGENNIYKK
jgi:hypothetical protein